MIIIPAKPIFRSDFRYFNTYIADLFKQHAWLVMRSWLQGFAYRVTIGAGEVGG
jgi:hypothetical protein